MNEEREMWMLSDMDWVIVQTIEKTQGREAAMEIGRSFSAANTAMQDLQRRAMAEQLKNVFQTDGGSGGTEEENKDGSG